MKAKTLKQKAETRLVKITESRKISMALSGLARHELRLFLESWISRRTKNNAGDFQVLANLYLIRGFYIKNMLKWAASKKTVTTQLTPSEALVLVIIYKDECEYHFVQIGHLMGQLHQLLISHAR